MFLQALREAYQKLSLAEQHTIPLYEAYKVNGSFNEINSKAKEKEAKARQKVAEEQVLLMNHTAELHMKMAAVLDLGHAVKDAEDRNVAKVKAIATKKEDLINTKTVQVLSFQDFPN